MKREFQKNQSFIVNGTTRITILEIRKDHVFLEIKPIPFLIIEGGTTMTDETAKKNNPTSFT